MRLGGVTGAVVATLLLSTIAMWAVPPAQAEADIPNHLMSLSCSAVYETFVEQENSWGIALGGEYEHRITRWWGLGALVEFTSETRDFLLAIPVSFHFWRGARLIGAPAIELGEPKVGAIRTGVGYDWETVAGYSIGFEIFVDFLEDERRTYLLGASAGRIF